MDDNLIGVAVVIERLEAPNRWEDWQFRLMEVVPDSRDSAVSETPGEAPQTAESGGNKTGKPRLLSRDGPRTRWLYAGWRLQLYPDECKGYFLNLTSGNPGWFVSWVLDANDPSCIELTGVSVSYIEADRRMFAEEKVETVPLQSELCEWLRLFTNQHFRPDSARKVRAASFLQPQERERILGGGRAVGGAENLENRAERKLPSDGRSSDG